MINVSRRGFLRYTLTPEFRPRLQELLFSGFKQIPFLIALVYNTVKLLPADHPYLNPLNVGRFTIRQVIAEAANNLVFSRKNIDQIILFSMVLVALMLIFVQIVLLCMSLFMTTASAATISGVPVNNFKDFFVTEKPQQDLAMIMLDMVFGVQGVGGAPSFFGSCIGAQIICADANGVGIVDTGGNSIFQAFGWPFPIHHALHEMFRLYNLGLTVVAALITCYFIATVLLETAQTGTPFGKRFNKLWAPIRIVVAFGLIMPLGIGLNSSQYIVLYAAKFGSGFASNGWHIFNSTLTDKYYANPNTMISQPKTPTVTGLLQFVYTASVCSWLEWARNKQWVSPYVIKGPGGPNSALLFAEVPYEDDLGNPVDAVHQDYDTIMKFIEGDSNIVIRWGVYDENTANASNMTVNYKGKKYKGHVAPICGELIIPLSDPRQPGKAEKGTEVMQRYYVYLIQELYADVYSGNPPNYPPLAQYMDLNFAKNKVLHDTEFLGQKDITAPTLEDENPGYANAAQYRSDLQTFYTNDIIAALTDPGSTGLDDVVGSGIGAMKEQAQSLNWTINTNLADKGWAGAAMWYNKIAELNGSITEAVIGIPSVSRWPEIMEIVRDKKRQQDQRVPNSERFKPELADGQDVPLPRGDLDKQFALILWKSFNFWQKDIQSDGSGNFFVDMVKALFGIEGLYSMRENPDVHPLAQLAGIGKSLVESSIRNLTFATAAGGGALLFSSFDNFIGGSASVLGSYAITAVTITLSAGFVLYYIVPFLPFIYFFFALGGWLKAIFEAMVGAPLWALAHIRIDGNGLPGSAAVNGYFLIFEIFLRPILMVFGLLASISIFAALVSVLNSIWDLVTSNLTGFDAKAEASAAKGAGISLTGYFRSEVDKFFFTIVYAIVVYMIGMSSFKLIDLIPANILRWMGQSVATENDAKENAAESMVSTSSVGSQQAVQNVGGSLKEAVSKAGQKSGGGGSE